MFERHESGIIFKNPENLMDPTVVENSYAMIRVESGSREDIIKFLELKAKEMNESEEYPFPISIVRRGYHQVAVKFNSTDALTIHIFRTAPTVYHTIVTISNWDIWGKKLTSEDISNIVVDLLDVTGAFISTNEWEISGSLFSKIPHIEESEESV